MVDVRAERSDVDWVKSCEAEASGPLGHWGLESTTQTSAGLRVGVVWEPPASSGPYGGERRVRSRSAGAGGGYRDPASVYARLAVKSHGVAREEAVILADEHGGSKTQLFGTGSFKLPGYRPRKVRAGWSGKPHGGSAPDSGAAYAARESRKYGVPYMQPNYVSPKDNAGVYGLMCLAPGQLPMDVESMVSETGLVYVKCRPNVGHHPAARGFWFRYQLPGKVEVESARATMDQGMFMISVLPKPKTQRQVKHATLRVEDTPCVHVVNCQMAKRKAGCFGGDGVGQQDSRTDTKDLGVNRWGDKDKWTGKPLPAYKPLTQRQLELSLPRRAHFAKSRGGVALPPWPASSGRSRSGIWEPATHAEEEWKAHARRGRSA